MNGAALSCMPAPVKPVRNRRQHDLLNAVRGPAGSGFAFLRFALRGFRLVLVLVLIQRKMSECERVKS
jgi:hypothetical protein